MPDIKKKKISKRTFIQNIILFKSITTYKYLYSKWMNVYSKPAYNVKINNFLYISAYKTSVFILNITLSWS